MAAAPAATPATTSTITIAGRAATTTICARAPRWHQSEAERSRQEARRREPLVTDDGAGLQAGDERISWPAVESVIYADLAELGARSWSTTAASRRRCRRRMEAFAAQPTSRIRCIRRMPQRRHCQGHQRRHRGRPAASGSCSSTTTTCMVDVATRGHDARGSAATQREDALLRRGQGRQPPDTSMEPNFKPDWNYRYMLWAATTSATC